MNESKSMKNFLINHKQEIEECIELLKQITSTKKGNEFINSDDDIKVLNNVLNILLDLGDDDNEPLLEVYNNEHEHKQYINNLQYKEMIRQNMDKKTNEYINEMYENEIRKYNKNLEFHLIDSSSNFLLGIQYADLVNLANWLNKLLLSI